jgi:hypothetical protein
MYFPRGLFKHIRRNAALLQQHANDVDKKSNSICIKGQD